MTVQYTHPRDEMVGFLPDEAKSVLDVGCSSGSFGRELRTKKPNIHLVGIEPNADAASVAASIYDEVLVGRFPDVRAQLPRGDQYDAVYFNDVLEHMPTPEPALTAARELLTDHGVIVASIPNIRHISVIGPLVVRDEFRYRNSGILDTTHLRFFTGSSIRRLFAEDGWEILSMQGINRVLRIAEEKRRPWIGWLGKITRGWSDGFFFVQYVVVAKPIR